MSYSRDIARKTKKKSKYDNSFFVLASDVSGFSNNLNYVFIRNLTNKQIKFLTFVAVVYQSRQRYMFESNTDVHVIPFYAVESKKNTISFIHTVNKRESAIICIASNISDGILQSTIRQFMFLNT